MYIPVFFNRKQLDHKPLYEWAMGEKIEHPETTSRAENILSAVSNDPSLFKVFEPKEIEKSVLKKVHRPGIISLYEASKKILEGTTFYPSVFPKKRDHDYDPDDIRRAGYFCFDSGTPLTSTTWDAAVGSASSANDASLYVESGAGKVAYALCRPPGHHASRDLFGGYCYFNNAGIIATRVKKQCRVVILDIDFHHGNGTQEIFYKDKQVLFISIHGHPKEFYPFFSGFEHEVGADEGKGFNCNITLPKSCDGQEYMKTIRKKVIPMIKAFDPGFFILSAGFDTYKKDPIGKFTLDTSDYNVLGEELAKINLPTVILQEGGYCVDELGANVVSFLRGFTKLARPKKIKA